MGDISRFLHLKWNSLASEDWEKLYFTLNQESFSIAWFERNKNLKLEAFIQNNFYHSGSCALTEQRIEFYYFFNFTLFSPLPSKLNEFEFQNITSDKTLNIQKDNFQTMIKSPKKSCNYSKRSEMGQGVEFITVSRTPAPVPSFFEGLFSSSDISAQLVAVNPEFEIKQPRSIYYLAEYHYKYRH